MLNNEQSNENRKVSRQEAINNSRGMGIMEKHVKNSKNHTFQADSNSSKMQQKLFQNFYLS